MTSFTRSSLVGLTLLAFAAGCTIQEKDEAASGGAAGSGAAAGTAGGAGASGSGGSADAGSDPCGDVPAVGRCVDGSHLERCLAGESDQDTAHAASVLSAACPKNTRCVEDDQGARCELTAQCHDGEHQCQDGATLRTCVNGQWSTTSCAPGPCIGSTGTGAMCVSLAPSTTYPITGRLRYEYLLPNATRSGYDATPLIEDARGVIAAAYDNNEYLGSVYTSVTDGTFTIEASQAPTATTYLYFYPVLYSAASGSPVLAIAKPKITTMLGLAGDEYWWFGAATDGLSDVGDVVVSIADGSGALYIYSWLYYAQSQAAAFSGKPATSVIGLWEPDKKFGCGNGTCYYPKGWGVNVGPDGATDYFATAVLLAGTEETPHQWSRSVILHEYGHGMMDVYSRLPNEAATHSVISTARPGQAWSEGWASYFGQSIIGDPVYFDKQVGVSWWFDIAAGTVNGSSQSPLPDASGPLDQEVGEMVIANMLWHLWDGSAQGTEESWDSSNLADPLLWKAFGSDRMLRDQYNTGYHTVDFADFLDSLRCEGAPNPGVASVTTHFQYPSAGELNCVQ